jgi:hypothetical protein
MKRLISIIMLVLVLAAGYIESENRKVTAGHVTRKKETPAGKYLLWVSNGKRESCITTDSLTWSLATTGEYISL